MRHSIWPLYQRLSSTKDWATPTAPIWSQNRSCAAQYGRFIKELQVVPGRTIRAQGKLDDPQYFYLKQGLTLVHFSAQLEPCLTQKNALYTLITP